MRKTKISLGLIISVVFLCLAYACLWVTSTPCPVYPWGNKGLPDFVVFVFPYPDSEISFTCYTQKNLQQVLMPVDQESGIVVSILPLEFLDLELPRTHLEENIPFENRVDLYLDKARVDTFSEWRMGSGIVYSGDEIDLPGQYTFMAIPFLFPGDHTAKIIIRTKSGEILEFEWKFTIVW